MPELTVEQLEALYLARQAEKSAIIESRQSDSPDPDPYVSEPVDPEEIRARNVMLYASGDPTLNAAIIAARQDPGPAPYHTEPVDRDAIAAHNEKLRADGYK